MVQIPRIAPSVAIEHYDPLEPPDPKAWLALDELEREQLVEDYHREAGIGCSRDNLHAILHVTVENQVALGDEQPVARTLQRLIAEGLDRHDALHAIGLELVMHMNELVRKGEPDGDSNQGYFDALERLTAESWRRSADDPDEEPAEAERILDGLTSFAPLPVEAIRAAQENRDTIAPLFVEAIDQSLGAENSDAIKNALFFMFHLLGEWREKSAYRSLAKFLRQPPTEVDDVLGGARTETSHRVMAAVFDGDPQPLYDIILDSKADEFIRSRMCEAVAMVTLRGELPRAEAERFLRACYCDLEPKHNCFVWDGWQGAIAMLGLVELEPLVEQAFRHGFVDPGCLSFEDFKGDLRRAIEGSGPPAWQAENEFELFGDTIEELSDWACFQPEPKKRSERLEPKKRSERKDAGTRVWSPLDDGPAVNPLKGVGRNDPCPCGSGKKFKKCCLK